MSEEKRAVKRRELLRTGLQLTAAAAVGGAGVSCAAASKSKKIPATGSMPTRVFGKTRLELPVLAFGGAQVARWGGRAQPMEKRVRLVRHAYEQGIRYFDTAREYREGEAVFGEALKDVRDNVYLNTKVDVVKPSDVRRTVELSLKDFQTDYIDGVQIHGTPGIECMTVKGAMAVRDALAELRDQGMIRFIGLTGHLYFDKILELISTGGFDTVMVANGYFRKGMVRLMSSEMVELREMCVQKAHELGMGILAMKVLGGWVLSPRYGAGLAPGFSPEKLKGLPGAAIRYKLQDERVHLLCIGVGGPQDIDDNVKTLSGDLTFTSADRALLAEFCARAYPAYEAYLASRS
jgi:predicted aldo/keto reductase-like oxidoreductase